MSVLLLKRNRSFCACCEPYVLNGIFYQQDRSQQTCRILRHGSITAGYLQQLAKTIKVQDTLSRYFKVFINGPDDQREDGEDDQRTTSVDTQHHIADNVNTDSYKEAHSHMCGEM